MSKRIRETQQKQWKGSCLKRDFTQLQSLEKELYYKIICSINNHGCCDLNNKVLSRNLQVPTKELASKLKLLKDRGYLAIIEYHQKRLIFPKVT